MARKSARETGRKATTEKRTVRQKDDQGNSLKDKGHLLTSCRQAVPRENRNWSIHSANTSCKVEHLLHFRGPKNIIALGDRINPAVPGCCGA